MHEGDIVVYDLSPYGVEHTVAVTILEIIQRDRIKVKPIDQWPIPHWGETAIFSSEYIVDYIYTIEPKTPPR